MDTIEECNGHNAGELFSVPWQLVVPRHHDPTSRYKNIVQLCGLLIYNIIIIFMLIISYCRILQFICAYR